MEKKQSSLSIAIGMACVWMGTHFGPGVASGTQILVYWVKYGIWGTLASILAMGLLGYCIYCAADRARRIPQRDRKSAQQPIRSELLGRCRRRYRLRRSSLRIRCQACCPRVLLYDVPCYHCSRSHHYHVRVHRQAPSWSGTRERKRRKCRRDQPELPWSYLERNHLRFLPG